MTPAFKITWGVKVKYLMVIQNYNFEQMRDGYFFGVAVDCIFICMERQFG